MRSTCCTSSLCLRRLVAWAAFASFSVFGVAGCDLQGGASGARSPSTVVRWEYLCIDAYGGVTHSANQLGKDGWEMAAAAGTSDHMMWCFKRPLPQ